MGDAWLVTPHLTVHAIPDRAALQRFVDEREYIRSEKSGTAKVPPRLCVVLRRLLSRSLAQLCVLTCALRSGRRTFIVSMTTLTSKSL